MGQAATQMGDGDVAGRTAARVSFDREIVQLRRRLVREAATAIEMLEAAVALLGDPDRDAIAAVLQRDDAVDAEEVSIEEACLRIIALQQPLGRDLRALTFILKVNANVERVADHACSIAKIARKLAGPPALPTALRELCERVPIMCQRLMRAVLDEDVPAARAVVAMDDVIDAMTKRLFSEVLDMMQADAGRREALANGLHLHRAGRELERVGDLMADIAEEVVFLSTGAIIRHESKKGAGAA
jgi:phosphate transport system protein